MVNYPYSEDAVQCPYCNSEDSCEHLFASYDKTFNSLEGGFLYDNDAIKEVLSTFFVSIIEKYGLIDSDHFSDYPELGFIWDEIIENEDDYCNEDKFDKDYFYLLNFNSYLLEKLDVILMPEFGEFEGGPGQSSEYHIYYTDKPQEVLLELCKSITAELENITLAIEKNLT